MDSFDRDPEFARLLARRTDIDLTTAALELARDAHPDLDFQPTLVWIEARAAELRATVLRAASERDALEQLSQCLGKEHGLHGDRDAFSQAESSYLNRVIETRRGIPISLSLAYLAVGQRAGLDLHGVSAPMHFLVRCETADGPLLIDPFNRGRILEFEECLNWVRALSGLPAETAEETLRPAAPREIIIRMLKNLKIVHAKQENWDGCWRVQQRLSALNPGSYEERRDLAVVSIKANRAGQAIRQIEACLRVCPEDEKSDLQQHLHEAKLQLARWN